MSSAQYILCLCTKYIPYQARIDEEESSLLLNYIEPLLHAGASPYQALSHFRMPIVCAFSAHNIPLVKLLLSVEEKIPVLYIMLLLLIISRKKLF